MTHETTREDGSVVLRVRGELDAVTAPEIRPTIDRLVEERAPAITVDLSELRLIDSSGVGALVSLYKRARSYGATFQVRGIKDQPLAILRLLRLDRVLAPAEPQAA